MKIRIAKMLLVLMLMAVFIPTSIYAATENEISDVTVISINEPIPTGDSYLSIKDTDGDIGTDRQTIRLLLENAEWTPEEQWSPYEFRYYNNGFLVANGNNFAVSFTRITDTRMDITFSMDPGDVGRETDEIRIPIKALVSSVGDASVEIDSLNSVVSAGVYAFAEGIKSDAIVRTGEKTIFGPRTTAKLEEIEIIEASVGSISMQEAIRFRLTPGFEWVENASISIEGSDGFEGSTEISLNEIMTGEREVNFTLEEIGMAHSGSSERGKISLSDLELTTSGERFGDVQIITAGVLGDQRLTVAEYMDYTTEARREGPKTTVYAGRFNQGAGEGFELAPLVIEEKVFASMSPGRPVDVAFSDWVKLTRVDGVATEEFQPGDNAFTFTPERDETGGKLKFEILVEATLHPDSAGDITASVTGGGIVEPLEAILGEAIQPLEVLTEPVILVAEDEENLSPEITLRETSYRALMEGDLEIILGVGTWGSIPEIMVTEGDIEIGDISVIDERLIIEIVADSSAASEIKVSEAPVVVEGLPAIGKYPVSISGDAIVTNNIEPYFEQEYLKRLEVLEVALNRISKAEFKVNQPYYLVDGEQFELDAAPYIAEGRLMVPVAHVSRALGIHRDDVLWDADAQTVTVQVETTQVVMTIGSDVMSVNGEEEDMGASAEIVDNRSFVPISRFARAIDVQYEWDAEEETVIFTK
ncbi:Copper amine oxidase N-terminal domain-containing protein [Tindallia magadiensis]|uniref:Copper amine oxidase N-terminal domain-containing protein n=1 Tax=Tindallia magadiensis TaxID=69895 RepID=A0A1I3D0W8_9FIRM|nr:copper amine oxidase N-terminal domain-containing protein [Tindallia magadiensis]SFH80353.1 Copper amine oxidase N-terminal domain-containing protein [Tindallia magadiensis]